MKKRVAAIIRIRPVISGGAGGTVKEKMVPLAVRRIGEGGVQIIEEKSDKSVNRASTFSFDHIFDMDSTQFDVYEESVAELVDSAILGHDAIIMAYGQTGSGKTYTMIGDVGSNPLEADLLTPGSGVFLRVMTDLMDYKDRLEMEHTHLIVGISCIEIYNDKIRDLFGGASPQSEPPGIKPIMIQDAVYLPDLTIKEVTSLQSVYTEVRIAIARRQNRATESNSTSSRSHCIFTLELMQQPSSAPPPEISFLHEMNKGNNSCIKIQSGDDSFHGSILTVPGQVEPVHHSRIMLADLAGSEKIKKSGVSGKGLAEANSINLSLTALGDVVHALHTGGHANYRNSNLTRLLRPGLSHPTLQLLLLAHVTPTQLTFDESVSTMHFANKIKAMKVEQSRNVKLDTLPLEYLDVLRVNHNLSTDLNLFSLECATRLTLSECNLSLRDKTFSLSLTSHNNPKQEMDSLKQRGAFEAAKKIKALTLKESKDRYNALVEELKYLVEEQKQKCVDDYMKELTEFKGSIKELNDGEDESITDSKLVIAHESVSREEVQVAEAEAWRKVSEKVCQSYLRVIRKELKASKEAKKKLDSQQKKCDIQPSQNEALLQLQSDSALYSKQCRRHVDGRRCVNLIRYSRALRAKELAILQNIFIYQQIPKAI